MSIKIGYHERIGALLDDEDPPLDRRLSERRQEAHNYKQACEEREAANRRIVSMMHEQTQLQNQLLMARVEIDQLRRRLNPAEPSSLLYDPD